jgi:hypothetical protein
MVRNSRSALAVVLLGLTLAGAQAGAPSAADAQAAATAGETFTGNLVSLLGGANTATRFELKLERYATQDEIDQLGALADRRQLALQEVLWESEMGYIRVGSELGYPVGLAFVVPGEGGRRTVYAVIDRPIQLYEIWRGLRSRDYPFSVVELELDADGTGEGRLYAVSRVHFGTGRVVIEDLQPQPFRILEVRRT